MKIKKIFLPLLFTCLTLFTASMPVQAADAIGYIKEFEDVAGEGQYVNPKYGDGYILDIEETGLLESGDKFLNDFANVIFSVVRNATQFTTAVFYFAMDFDVAKLFAGQIDFVQKALKETIFDSFFILAFAGAMFLLIKKMARGNMIGVIGELAKIVLIVVLSSLIVTSSSTILSGTTSITKSISVSILSGLNEKGGINITSYSANASGMLHKTLLHDLWVTLEFDNTNPSQQDVENFLLAGKNSDARTNLVKQYQSSHPGSFDKKLGVSRIGYIIIYLIPFLIKAVVFILLAALQLGCQALALLYVLMAPVILLLALIPGFGELGLITGWFKNIFKTQIDIVMVTFLIGIVVMFDTTIYSLSGALGWMPVLILETLITVMLVVYREKIFKGFTTVMKNKVSNAKMAMQSPALGSLGGANYDLARLRMREQTMAKAATTSSPSETPKLARSLSLKVNQDAKKWELKYNKGQPVEVERPSTFPKRFYNNKPKQQAITEKPTTADTAQKGFTITGTSEQSNGRATTLRPTTVQTEKVQTAPSVESQSIAKSAPSASVPPQSAAQQPPIAKQSQPTVQRPVANSKPAPNVQRPKTY